MGNINLKQLETFVLVADLSSFRKAATVLQTTQPNISTRIARLEEYLGQTLLVRDAGSVRLTQSGTRLLSEARKVLRSLDDFKAAADAQGLFEGTLRLGVTEMVVYSWLSEYLGEIRKVLPNVKVELTVDMSSNLTSALLNHSIDLALQSGPFNQKTSGEIQLGRYSLVWVASTSLTFRSELPDRSALCQHPILTHAKQTIPFRQLEKHFASETNAYLVPSTSLGACMRLTLEGLGVACLPYTMVADEIKAGRLKKLPYAWTPDDLSFSARFHTERASHHLHQAAELAREVTYNSNV